MPWRWRNPGSWPGLTNWTSEPPATGALSPRLHRSAPNKSNHSSNPGGGVEPLQWWGQPAAGASGISKWTQPCGTRSTFRSGFETNVEADAAPPNRDRDLSRNPRQMSIPILWTLSFSTFVSHAHPEAGGLPRLLNVASARSRRLTLPGHPLWRWGTQLLGAKRSSMARSSGVRDPTPELDAFFSTRSTSPRLSSWS
jgi:hypothetical protein